MKTFILRTKVHGERNFFNRIIGDSYEICNNYRKPKESPIEQREDWAKEVRKHFSEMKKTENIKAIVVSFDAFIIYDNMNAWIMNQDGSTFEKIA